MISNDCGFCAVCGWSGPPYTLSFFEQLTAETVLGQHAPDGLLDGLARVLVEQVAVGGRAQTTGVAGVAVGHLVFALVARQRDLVGVDDDDEVAGVHVRGVRRLVLATQEGGGLDGEPSEHHVSGVDDMPLTRDVAGLGAVRAHGR